MIAATGAECKPALLSSCSYGTNGGRDRSSRPGTRPEPGRRRGLLLAPVLVALPQETRRPGNSHAGLVREHAYTRRRVHERSRMAPASLLPGLGAPGAVPKRRPSVAGTGWPRLGAGVVRSSFSAEGTAGNGAPRWPALGEALGSQERSRRPFSLSWGLSGGRQFGPSAPSGRAHPAKLFMRPPVGGVLDPHPDEPTMGLRVRSRCS